MKACPKLNALIQECWRVRRKERPNFDEIVKRLQGDIGDEIKRREEPKIELYSKEDDVIYRDRIGRVGRGRGRRRKVAREKWPAPAERERRMTGPSSERESDLTSSSSWWHSPSEPSASVRSVPRAATPSRDTRPNGARP